MAPKQRNPILRMASGIPAQAEAYPRSQTERNLKVDKVSLVHTIWEQVGLPTPLKNSLKPI